MFEHDYVNYPELTNAQIADFGFTSPHTQFTEDFDAVVVKVHDGDTITLKSPTRDFPFPLRFLNVDARELSEGGEDARDWLKARLLGEEVRILIDRSQRVGKWGRLLGRVIHGGLDVSQEMLHLGLVSNFGQRDEGKIPNISKWYMEGKIK